MAALIFLSVFAFFLWILTSDRFDDDKPSLPDGRLYWTYWSYHWRSINQDTKVFFRIRFEPSLQKGAIPIVETLVYLKYEDDGCKILELKGDTIVEVHKNRKFKTGIERENFVAEHYSAQP